MKQTVIGIFNNTSDAQNAVEALLDNGFTEGNVDFSANNSTMSSGDATAKNNDNESGISKFFKNLFGADDESDRYTKAAEQGSVVTVHTKTSEEASDRQGHFSPSPPQNRTCTSQCIRLLSFSL